MEYARYVRTSTLPSIGMLARSNSIDALDRHVDLNNYINDTFTSRATREYFGSKYDPYYSAFQDTIQKHFSCVDSRTRRYRDALAETIRADVIRPVVTFEALRWVSPVMYRPILTEPTMYQALKDGRIQGYGDLLAEDLKDWVKVYSRIIDENGSLDCDPTLPKDQEQHIHWTWSTDDPELTALQIQDLRRTREFVKYIMTDTNIDPTDPTDIQG